MTLIVNYIVRPTLRANAIVEIRSPTRRRLMLRCFYASWSLYASDIKCSRKSYLVELFPILETVFTEYIFVETEFAATRQRIDQPFDILCRDKDIRRLILAAKPGRRTQNGIGLDPDVAEAFRFLATNQKMLLLPESGQRYLQPPSLIAGIRHHCRPLGITLVEQVGVQLFVDPFDCFYLVHGYFIETRWMHCTQRHQDKANTGYPCGFDTPQIKKPIVYGLVIF